MTNDRVLPVVDGGSGQESPGAVSAPGHGAAPEGVRGGAGDGGAGDAHTEGTVVTRRDVVRLLSAAPLAAFAISLDDVDRATRYAASVLQGAAQQAQRYTPKFFTAQEWRTVRLLADIVIPRDARSGSATDAGVPEFMDFMMTAYPDMQTRIRDGLAWLDRESVARSRRPFVEATAAQQRALLDAIAYPKRAAPAVKDGVEFFSRFRDLTASGFWSSRIGAADLQYMGNRPQPAWNGCPPAALRKAGV